MKLLDKILGKKIGKAPHEEEARAKVVSQEVQKNLASLKNKEELAVIKVDRNRWSLLSIILAICLLVSIIGWNKANERFANHVKVAFVKMEPSGRTTVDLEDENFKSTPYINTINSLLINYAERRFRKISYDIKADYAYVLNFMSPQKRNDFISTYHAARVAAEFSQCTTCPQIDIKYRTLQHDESDPAIVNGKPETIHKTTIFVLATQYNPDGTILGKSNEIVTLTWRLTNISEETKNTDKVIANPIGLDILDDAIKADPTPVN